MNIFGTMCDRTDHARRDFDGNCFVCADAAYNLGMTSIPGSPTPTPLTWTCERPGRWVGSDGTNIATATRIREGILHGAEWMWFVKVNGKHITNEDTLVNSKKIVAKYLADPTVDLYA